MQNLFLRADVKASEKSLEDLNDEIILLSEEVIISLF